jgi:hypothetical protein
MVSMKQYNTLDMPSIYISVSRDPEKLDTWHIGNYFDQSSYNPFEKHTEREFYAMLFLSGLRDDKPTSQQL